MARDEPSRGGRRSGPDRGAARAFGDRGSAARVGRAQVAASCERISLAILLVILALRPLIAETYESAITGISRVLPGAGHPTPTHTALIDWFILTAALLYSVAAAVRGEGRYRRAGIEIGAVILAAAAMVSCMAASNKRLAMIATADWLGMILVMIMLVQLVRRPWHARLVLCVVLASGLTSAVKCVQQHAYEFDETIREYQEREASLWAQEGVSLDDPQVELYRKRLRGRAATAFLVDPNVAGSYLLLCAFAAGGFALAKIRGPKKPFRLAFGWVAVALAGVAVVAVGLTKSRGAILGLVIGAAIWVGVERLAGRLYPLRRRVLVLGWAVAGAAALAAVGYGMATGGLPTDSLRFRWAYWSVSARMIADRPWTGVGTGNFGRHYTEYKTIEQPEEIKDPHNLFVKAAAEWGLPGAVGLLAILIAGSTRFVIGPRSIEQVAAERPSAMNAPGRPLVWAAIVLIGTFVCQSLVLRHDSFAGFVVATFIPACVWLIAMGALLVDSDQLRLFEDDELRGCGLAMACGLLAFLVVNLITFSLFVPGVGTTFFALAGVACSRGSRATGTAKEPSGDAAGAQADQGERRTASGRWALVGLLAAGTAGYGALVVRPVAVAGRHLADARSKVEIRGRVDSAGQLTAHGRLAKARSAVELRGVIDAANGRAAGTVQFASAGTTRSAKWLASLVPQPRQLEQSGQVHLYRGRSSEGWVVQFALDRTGSLTGMSWNPSGRKEHYLRAIRADQLDPTGPAEYARFLLEEPAASAGEALQLCDEAVAWVQEAIRRDPQDVGKHRMLSGVYQRRFAASSQVNDAVKAVEAARQAVKFYPSLPSGHVALGDRLVKLAGATQPAEQRAGMIAEAIKQYEHALQLDDARAPDEIRRFPPRIREEIRGKLSSLLMMLRELGSADGRSPANVRRG